MGVSYNLDGSYLDATWVNDMIENTPENWRQIRLQQKDAKRIAKQTVCLQGSDVPLSKKAKLKKIRKQPGNCDGDVVASADLFQEEQTMGVASELDDIASQVESYPKSSSKKAKLTTGNCGGDVDVASADLFQEDQTTSDARKKSKSSSKKAKLTTGNCGGDVVASADLFQEDQTPSTTHARKKNKTEHHSTPKQSPYALYYDFTERMVVWNVDICRKETGTCKGKGNIS
jgi:hypothetical protein